ncbi:hypothetical protein [Chelatococcus sp. XZ-Ab1]|uniref:hypothetical protein n=1 Tax=Chelatococcus sp. XZ-Ab1 TaxID=3034027 RepID=UPI0023E43F4F|nr:hypothetical protein [Chelatococcus sp. XZ-Ab1]
MIMSTVTLADLDQEERSILFDMLVEANPWLVREADLWWARSQAFRRRASKEFDRYVEAGNRRNAAHDKRSTARSARTRLAADSAYVKANEAMARHWRAYERCEQRADEAWNRAYPPQEPA